MGEWNNGRMRNGGWEWNGKMGYGITEEWVNGIMTEWETENWRMEEWNNGGMGYGN